MLLQGRLLLRFKRALNVHADGCSLDALLRVPTSLIVTLNTNAEWMLAGRAAARPYIALRPLPLALISS
jgi:hypothetical protein